MANRINCYQCAHLQITWDPKLPRACKFFGFKSEGMPSLTVYKTTGSECVAFKQKEGANKKN